MNTRQLKYEPVQSLDFMVVHETTYKGHRIQRQRGKDQYGLTNNTLFIWKKERYRKLSVILKLIDNQIEQ